MSMAWNSDYAREKMIEQQIRAWEVLDPRVLRVFEELPREHFVPETMRSLAYADTQIPLGHGEVMMAPKIEARLLQALDLSPEDRVLEVGTGSGFLTACLAKLAGEVHSADIHADFTRQASTLVHNLGLRKVHFETRDASRLDWVRPSFDVIAVTGSMPLLEPSFLHALAVGGRLFVIVGTDPIMEALLITRTAEDDWTRESLFETHIPPLVNAYSEPGFSF